MPNWEKLRKELFETMDTLTSEQWKEWSDRLEKKQKAAEIKSEYETKAQFYELTFKETYPLTFKEYKKTIEPDKNYFQVYSKSKLFWLILISAIITQILFMWICFYLFNWVIAAIMSIVFLSNSIFVFIIAYPIKQEEF